jgi:hypothetical protein
MSKQTLVLYLENEDLKLAIQQQALQNHQSVSKWVGGILKESLKTKQPKNKLLKYTGSLKHISQLERQKIDQSMLNFRQSLNLEKKG